MNLARIALIAQIAAFLILMSARGARAQTTSRTAADTLERMARAEFGDLTAAELRIVRTAPTPEIAWASPAEDPDLPLNDPSKAETWGRERTIRAPIIVWLLSNPAASKYAHPSGIGAAAARIIGKLDLSYVMSNLPLTLIDCSIPEGIDISYSHLKSIDLRRSWTGPIFGDQSVVNGDLSFDRGRYGEVSLFRARIDGNIDCSAARMIGDDPFSAIDATIGDIEFHDGFETAGVIDLRLAHVDRSVSFNNARFIGKADNGLNAERAIISGTLYWVNVATTPHTQLDLENTHAGSLWDDEQSWPAPGNLDIKGFVYGDFSGGPATGIARLRWLRRQPISLRAQPQPYRQLAHVLREEGAQEGAVRVEIARENALTAYGDISFPTRLWRTALRATIGYGYRPLRAVWWILLFVLMGTGLFQWGYWTRLITPTEEGAYETFVSTGLLPRHYPPFNSFIYSLENFLPVVDLHQGAFWRPNPHHRPERSGRVLKWSGERMPARLLRCYLWLHILAGWTITPLLFAGLAGLLRSD